jgi:hypothetical protein
LISAGTLGYLVNNGLNLMMPPPNQEQKAQLESKIETQIIDNYEKEKKLQQASPPSP